MDTLGLVDALQLLHVLGTKRDELPVLFDARGGNRLGEDGRVAGNCGKLALVAMAANSVDLRW